MSKSLIVTANQVAITDAATAYIGITGGSTTDISEPRVETPIRKAGVFSNLFVFVSANTVSVNSPITLRKNQANSAVTLTVGADQTGIFEDNVNTETFANTDEAAILFAPGAEAGTNTITVRQLALEFTPTTSTDCITLMGGSLTESLANDSTTFYMVPGGGTPDSMSSTEANHKLRIRGAFTASNLYVHVTSNARTTDVTFKTRKNGADGGQSVTYNSTQTGVKEDTSGTDSLAAGDDYNYSMTTSTGGNSIAPSLIHTTLVNTSGQFILVASDNAGWSHNFNQTLYVYPGGRGQITGAENSAAIYPRFTFTAKELGVYVSANTIATSPTVITLRDNGADSAVTVSFSAAQTGLLNDSTNTATITAGTDEIAYKMVTPNTSGSMTYRWMSILGETAGAASAIKTVLGLAKASVKTFNGLAIASVKSIDGLQ